MVLAFRFWILNSLFTTFTFSDSMPCKQRGEVSREHPRALLQFKLRPELVQGHQPPQIPHSVCGALTQERAPGLPALPSSFLSWMETEQEKTLLQAGSSGVRKHSWAALLPPYPEGISWCFTVQGQQLDLILEGPFHLRILSPSTLHSVINKDFRNRPL